MALSTVFSRLLFLFASVQASSHVEHLRVKATGRIETLEAKQDGVASSDVRESSTAARRDLLWQAVREVDNQFHQKYNCKLEMGTTYSKETVFLAGRTSYSKTNVASARECALMCAADSLDDRNHKNLACKSFMYNKTAHVCKFFNFGQQARDTWNSDPCCASGPPCNLDSMRQEIQSYFHVELERTRLSQKHLDNQPKAASKSLPDTMKDTQQLSIGLHENAVPKFDKEVARRVVKHAVPKAEQKATTQPVREVPNVEQKVVMQVEHVAPASMHEAKQSEPTFTKLEQNVAARDSKHVVPKIAQAAAAQSERAVPSVEQKAGQAGPKFEKKDARWVPKHPVPTVERKVPTQLERVVPKIEQKLPTQAAKQDVLAQVGRTKVATRVQHAMPRNLSGQRSQLLKDLLAYFQPKQKPVLSEPISPTEGTMMDSEHTPFVLLRSYSRSYSNFLPFLFAFLAVPVLIAVVYNRVQLALATAECISADIDLGSEPPEG